MRHSLHLAWLVFLGVFGLLVDARPAKAQNLIENGSFEQANMGGSYFPPGSNALPGWTITGDGVDYLSEGYDGQRCLDLNASNSGGVRQLVPTVPGVRYRLSFVFRHNYCQPYAPALMGVRVGSEYIPFASFLCGSLPCTWQPRTVYFDAEGPTTLVAFESADGGPCGPYLDFVRLEQITSATLRVPEEFNTIQEAVDEAIDGDTVLVAPGDHAGFYLLDKSVRVRSIAGPVHTSLHWAETSGSHPVVFIRGTGPWAGVDG